MENQPTVLKCKSPPYTHTNTHTHIYISQIIWLFPLIMCLNIDLVYNNGLRIKHCYNFEVPASSWRHDCLSKTMVVRLTVCHSGAKTWWRHPMETFSAWLAICMGNWPVTGEFPTQRPVTRSFGVFFDLRLNKRLSKQWWGWWFETPSGPLWRHCNEALISIHGSLSWCVTK